MDVESYEFMQTGVAYNSNYSVDGSSCVIKKAVDDIHLGLLTAHWPDGTVKRRHFAFFNLKDKAEK